MDRKVLSLLLVFFYLNTTVSFAVNQLTSKEEKLELDQKRTNKSSLTLKQKVGLYLINKWSKQKVKNSDKSKDRKVNRQAFISFLAGLVSNIGIIAAIAVSNTALLILFGLLGVGAFIFGVIGLRKIKKDPEIYKGKGLGIIGTALGSLSSLALLFLLFWIAFSLIIFSI